MGTVQLFLLIINPAMNPGPAKGFFIDKEQTRFYLVKLNSAT
jgi:hypothetical protein